MRRCLVGILLILFMIPIQAQYIWGDSDNLLLMEITPKLQLPIMPIMAPAVQEVTVVVWSLLLPVSRVNNFIDKVSVSILVDQSMALSAVNRQSLPVLEVLAWSCLISYNS